jgi:endonuclease YncB( thermonuclease family)
MRKSLVPWVAFVFLSTAHIAVAGGTMMKVLSIVNGTTIRAEVRGKEMQVRLLGIATPDPNDDKHPILKQLGAEARDFLDVFTKSRSVYAEFPSGEPVPDKDGIVNALIWGGATSELINQRIVSDGFGVVDRHQVLSAELRAQLIKAEDSARSSGRGLWGSFSLGHGQDIAAGKMHQGTYLGEIPNGGRQQSSEVSFWVIIFR